MNRKELWLNAIREEESLRANQAAWRLALTELSDENERALVRVLVRALEYALDCAERTQRGLWALYRKEEE